MTIKHYNKRHHVVDASHVREYPRALATDQHDVLKLAVDQFTPKSNPYPSPGDVTLIAAHANGIGKELYEPLWDDLFEAAERSGAFRIRNIWIMDVAWQGESSVLNEGRIGNDPSWNDTPRDLLLLTHHFREEMKMPMIGVGHSMGGHNIVTLAHMHPRLFSSIILIDPTIQPKMFMNANFLPTSSSTFRRDVWPSREEAAKAFLKNKFYQSWDKRVFDQWIQYGLRELPTAVYPENPISNKPSEIGSKPVTLTTPKHQEVFTFLRSYHPGAGESMSAYKPDRRTHPDLPDMDPMEPFYRSEPITTFSYLPHLRPRTLYIFPQDSPICPPRAIKQKLEITGYGAGGNGGLAEGGVQEAIIPKAGHFAPFEDPITVAGIMSDYVRDEVKQWRRNAALDQADAHALKGSEKFTLSKDRIWWTQNLRERLIAEQKAADATREAAAKREPKL